MDLKKNNKNLLVDQDEWCMLNEEINIKITH